MVVLMLIPSLPKIAKGLQSALLRCCTALAHRSVASGKTSRIARQSPSEH